MTAGNAPKRCKGIKLLFGKMKEGKKFQTYFNFSSSQDNQISAKSVSNVKTNNLACYTKEIEAIIKLQGMLNKGKGLF